MWKFDYSSGLFPLLGYAAMNVRPSLLKIYETYFVPLGDKLRPALSGFLSGVIPGYESGLDHFERTNSLLSQVCCWFVVLNGQASNWHSNQGLFCRKPCLLLHMPLGMRSYECFDSVTRYFVFAGPFQQASRYARTNEYYGKKSRRTCKLIGKFNRNCSTGNEEIIFILRCLVLWPA